MASKAASPLRAALPSTTLLPFLYRTQTLQKVFWSNSSSASSSQLRSTSTHTPDRTALYRPLSDVPFEAAPKAKHDDPTPFQDDISAPGPRRRRDSTITFAERETFTRIFNDIISSSEQGSSPSLSDNGNPFATGGPRERVRPDDDVNSILAGAAKASKSDPAKLKSTGDLSSFGPRGQEAPALGRSERIRQAIERYPPSLRAAAARALFAQRQEPEQSQIAEDTPEKVEVVDKHTQFVRHRELMRVEDMLNAAKTDMDVWKIVEEEVFSTIKKLNIELGEPVAKAIKKGRKIAKTKKKDMVMVLEDAKPDDRVQEKEAPSLSIIGPNYPAHLLVAARLFRHEFPTSPLALALLPAIKKLGPISYVLGASTALYNEIMYILWKTYGDFNGIEELLKDMDQGGVEFDEATHGMLWGIGKEARAIRVGQKGRTLEALYKMQTMVNSASALARWRKVVKARLREMRRATDNVGFEDDDEDTLDVA